MKQEKLCCVGIFIFIIAISSINTLDLRYLDPVRLQTRIDAATQQETALKIIQKYSKKVTVSVNQEFSDHKDVFTLHTHNRTLHIEASTGVAALWGFHYYLKKYCKSHLGWQNRRIAIPDDLPEVNLRVVASDRFRYYQNVCTHSYSFVWWNISQWLDHVEWMAFNGINLALAPVDQEAAWAKVYKEVGLTEEEIDSHFTGPAFLAWLRMGNVHGWAGPLQKSWHNRQSVIEKGVTKLMYKLGMVPVVPSFNGHVPIAFQRIFPNVCFDVVSRWNNFNNTYCCDLFLNPSEALFQTIGKMFLTEITRVTGMSHVYAADSFNEIHVGSMTSEEIRQTGKAIFSAMTNFDSEAVWLLQNWMFVNNPAEWNADKTEAILLSVPKGRILVLDLQSELRPQYEKFNQYFGQPYIWCMLHNFGGTSGMIGVIPKINKQVYKARTKENSTMIGIGLTPEGINQNYVVYDFMLEAGWRTKPVKDLKQWAKKYSERRYGCNSTSQAWKTLIETVYNYYDDREYYMLYPHYISIPTLSSQSQNVWYRSKHIFKAFKILVYADSSCESEGFYHDLVDIARQALQYRSEQIYHYDLRDYRYVVVNETVYRESVAEYLDVLNDIEKVLACNDHFTITSWLKDARSFAAEPKELTHYEFNARNQITMWGPNGEISDYAAKQWAEMFHYYYKPRWSFFLKAALDAKAKDISFIQKPVQMKIREKIEKPFASIDIKTLPKSNLREVAKSLYDKWYNKPNLPDLPLIMK